MVCVLQPLESKLRKRIVIRVSSGSRSRWSAPGWVRDQQIKREQTAMVGISDFISREDIKMRKAAILVIVMLVVFMFGAVAIAQDLGKVRGWVSKIDTEAKSVTILPEGGKPVTVIMNSAESLSKVDEGDEAEARYIVKDGKNMGRWLHKIGGGCS